jgi:predicted outer membrane lipoprotein
MALSVVAILLTWICGTFLTDSIKNAQIQRERVLELERSRRAAASQGVNSIAALMYDRRTRTELVLAALRRNAPIEEVRRRKEAYDSSYVAWNRSLQSTLLGVRQLVGEESYLSFEAYIEQGLAPHFRILDQIVTDAYDARLSGRQPPPEHGRNHIAELQAVLDCAYAITDALWIKATEADSQVHSSQTAVNYRFRRLEERCPQSTDVRPSPMGVGQDTRQ